MYINAHESNNGATLDFESEAYLPVKKLGDVADIF